MKKRLVIITLCLLQVATLVWAHAGISARSKLLLSQYETAARRAPSRVHSCQGFISVRDTVALKALADHGVKVDAVFDGFVTARIPLDRLTDLAAMDGIRHISLAQPVQLCNDSARFFSQVGLVHNSVGQTAPLRGKGVIVGFVDSGIDFSHINLRDADGNLRVKAVYLGADSTGRAPVINGDTMPGSCYETPGEIAALTADNYDTSHGTHTIGTAAGSFMGNGLHGVAPEADIVACGLPSSELNDVNIANAVRYIVDYADRVGRPCVINMSISSNSGPNDGSSFLCRVFDSLSGAGRICVLSAGNDGDAPICFHHSLAGGNDTVTTLLRNKSGGLQRLGYVSMWSDKSQQHRTRLVVINRATHELEYASPFLGLLPEDSVLTITSDNDPALGVYYTGKVEFASAVEPAFSSGGIELPEGRYHSFWNFDVTSNQSGHLLGLQYVSDSETRLTGWCNKSTYFYTFGLPGMTGGSSVGSISDLATSDSVISVGSYSTRIAYTDMNAGTHAFTKLSTGDISYFSSFGPDERGNAKPDLCAPGAVLLSSASRYDTVANRSIWPTAYTVDGVEYPYYANQGTSMSAPMVTGTVALMLQLSPSLTPSQVRASLCRSASMDAGVAPDEASRWGSGKLNTWGAVHDVIDRHMLLGDVNNDREFSVADIQAMIEILLGHEGDFDAATLIRADANRDNELQLADINAIINLILK